MKKTVPVSVVISAYNEEAKLTDCLLSVAWAQEIIVVDNESTDATSAIAKKMGAVVLTRKNNLMLNVNKNFGFSKASSDWILSLDADERVSEELAEEIAMVVTDPNAKEGYWIPRRNIIFGKEIKHTGWYPDYNLRLFKKRAGKFAEEHVHEMITLQGEAGHLKHAMIHLNYETVAQFLRKTIVIYAPNEAAQLVKNGYTFSFIDAFRMPRNEFLSRYFARQGYKDGFHGLMLSLLMAVYHLIVFANLWERNNFKEASISETLRVVTDETKKGSSDTRYWLYNEQIASTNNPLKKTALKVLRKL